MYLKLTKTYSTGATHSVNCQPFQDRAEIARIDAEDRMAGLVGYWTVEVILLPR